MRVNYKGRQNLSYLYQFLFRGQSTMIYNFDVENESDPYTSSSLNGNISSHDSTHSNADSQVPATSAKLYKRQPFNKKNIDKFKNNIRSGIEKLRTSALSPRIDSEKQQLRSEMKKIVCWRIVMKKCRRLFSMLLMRVMNKDFKINVIIKNIAKNLFIVPENLSMSVF